MPSPDDARFQLIISKRLLKRVDEWRRKQEEIPNKSDAIRRLIEQALDDEEPDLRTRQERAKRGRP